MFGSRVSRCRVAICGLFFALGVVVIGYQFLIGSVCGLRRGCFCSSAGLVAVAFRAVDPVIIRSLKKRGVLSRFSWRRLMLGLGFWEFVFALGVVGDSFPISDRVVLRIAWVFYSCAE